MQKAAISDFNDTDDVVLKKQERLIADLGQLSGVIIALSGGADSAYLAWAAHQALGKGTLCVTAISASFSSHDREQVLGFLRATGIRHQFIETQEVSNPKYAANDIGRCYFCKDELFSALGHISRQRGNTPVAYGINADDMRDFRPGHQAAKEHRVLSPLLDVGLTKSEIRDLSRRARLPTWDRPASACLASRIPYGTPVTLENLGQVDRGEAVLRELGFRQFRLRHHDTLARIEIAPDELPRALDVQMAATLACRLKQVGYRFVTLDLEGYRQGSLNLLVRSGGDRE